MAEEPLSRLAGLEGDGPDRVPADLIRFRRLRARW
jgi:hypothetical protein